MIKAGIIGATGYAGFELFKLLAAHPQVDLVFAACRSEAGRRMSDVFPVASDLVLQSIDDVTPGAADVLFLSLPHGAAHAWARRGLDAGCVVIDLSSDHRLQDPAGYRTWYGMDAPAHPGVYGITELKRPALAEARLIANPGCYPTSVLLALAPLLQAGHLAGARIIADCKSGTSGAGRSASVPQLFAEVNGNLKPYSVGHVHRHVAEMEQELPGIGGLVFSPHLLPVTRGILSTLYVPFHPQARELYEKFYAEEPFVWVLPEGQTATLAYSVDTNRCTISLHPVPEQQTLIVVSTIDNLVKGAAGQAVQSMNLRFGLAETTGLSGARKVHSICR